MLKPIGRCSKCGGDVVQEDNNHSYISRPTCCKCGARAKEPTTIIEMDESNNPQLLLD